MPSKNLPVSDLSALLLGLNEARVQFILVGGLAAVIQGAPVTTFDIDIVPRQSEENMDRLIKFLDAIDAIYRRPDDKVLKPQKKDLLGKGHILLSTRFGAIDILGTIEKDLGYDELRPSTVELDFKGDKILVLGLETIVALKQATSDPYEQYRLKVYEETLRLRDEMKTK